jgi:hypothetical protein
MTPIFKQKNERDQCYFLVKSDKLPVVRSMYATTARDSASRILSEAARQEASVYSVRMNGDQRASCMEMKS